MVRLRVLWVLAALFGRLEVSIRLRVFWGMGLSLDAGEAQVFRGRVSCYAFYFCFSALFHYSGTVLAGVAITAKSRGSGICSTVW